MKPINLYEHYKNSPKKLKIVCGWDEIIQACEPFANYLERGEEIRKEIDFPRFFRMFWEGKTVEYTTYSSKFVSWSDEIIKEQEENKNSPNFYQEAPFLTIAEDLLKLIREDKVEKLIFLSAYDKEKFPNGDERKVEIFTKTFGDFGAETSMSKCDNKFVRWGRNVNSCLVKEIKLQLIPFKNETQGRTKADWIKENAHDFDLMIDDNPEICQSLVDCKECIQLSPSENGVSFAPVECGKCFSGLVLVPCYPAVEQNKKVLLAENKVSNLKKEDFA